MNKVLFSILIILFPGLLHAQTGGNSTSSALNLVSSARIAASGGNMIAVKDADPSLGIYNPSLLNKGMDNTFSLSYVNYFGDINYGFLSYVKHKDSLATFAATFNYLNYGRFEERNEAGEKLGEFSAGDYVLNLSAGRQIDSSFSIGANLKTIYSSYYTYNALSMAVDVAGTYHKPGKGFTAALMMRNLGYNLKPMYTGNRESLPFEVQFAISQKLKHAPFRFHLAAENLQKWDLSYVDPTLKPSIDPTTGQEIPVKTPGFGDKLMRHMVIGTELTTKNFFIGFGYNYRRRKELKVNEKGGLAGFSFGMGMKIKKFQISYALATYNQAGLSNHITLSFRLDDFKRN